MTTLFLDIETSKIVTDCGYEMQVTFLTNIIEMCCSTGKIIKSTFFRTISETLDYFKNEFEDDIICWCHNLDYELTHILRDTQSDGITHKHNAIYDESGQNVLFRDKNAPLQITLDFLPFITFRDSYALFNKSVSLLGDELNLPKLDYDYKKVRLPWTDLEELDYNYVERDNIIVAKHIWEYMQLNKCEITDIPLTFTSDVKKRRKEYIESTTKLTKYTIDVEKSFTSYDAFMDLVYTYQGGLTTSCIEETGKYIDDIKTSGVIGIDIKSSYPYQMCTKKFPKFFNKKYYEGSQANEIFKEGNFKACYGIFKFKNIRLKNKKYLAHISSSMLSRGNLNNEKNARFNGKLVEGEEIQLYCNDIDLENISMSYDYDEISCIRLHVTDKLEYLRREEISFLLCWFHIKETTKDDNLKNVAKLIINSMYGIKVSMPIKNNYKILDGTIKVTDFFEFDNDTQKQYYENYVDTINANFGGIDMYSTGVYVTSYARNQLISKANWLVENGANVVYSDTDSIKFYCNTKEEMNNILQEIEKDNIKSIEKNSKLPRFRGYKNKNEVKDLDYKIICSLGIWEKEDKFPHKLFCTLGAKKYGYVTTEKYNNKNKKLLAYLKNTKDNYNYENNDNVDIIKTTIAGCNKNNVPRVIRNFARNENLSIQDSFKMIFTPGTTFDTTASGRTTAKKEDRDYIDFINMTYKGRKINQFGGIIIEDTTYTLSMTKEDSNTIGVNLINIDTISFDINGNYEYLEE